MPALPLPSSLSSVVLVLGQEFGNAAAFIPWERFDRGRMCWSSVATEQLGPAHLSREGGTLIQSFNSFVAVTSCQVWAKLSWSLIFCKFPEAEEQWGHRGPGQPGVPQRAWDPGPGYVNAKDSCRILGVSVAVSCSLVPSWIWGSGCRRYNWHSPFLWVLSPPAAALKGLVGGRGGWAGLWAFWGHQEGSDLCPLCHRSLLGV